MSFTIILEDATSRSLATISFPGNEGFLCQEDETIFPLLSRLDPSSYDTFSAAEMNDLLAELARLAPDPEEVRRHVEEIVVLADRCRKTAGTALTFTPFEASAS